MSIPRVGSSSIKISGSPQSHFPITTFCWFPPERFWTAIFMSKGLIFSFSDVSFAISDFFLLEIIPFLMARSMFATQMLCSTLSLRNKPCSFLSSGMKEIPCLFASSGEFNLISLPAIESFPFTALSAPNKPRASSLFPEPIIPVIPRISPFFRLKLTGASILSVLNSSISNIVSSDGLPSRTGNSSFKVLPSIDFTNVFRSTLSISKVPAF